MRPSESPSAAHRVWPMCSGPVGLALMNSRLITWPASASPRPYAAPASTMVRASSPAAAASSVMFRKPGPATPTDLMPGVAPRRAARSSASARGVVPAFFASCRATFVAQSPCSRCRGRSTWTDAGTASAGRASVPSATAAARAALSAPESSEGVTRRFYGRPRTRGPRFPQAGNVLSDAGRHTRVYRPASGRGQGKVRSAASSDARICHHRSSVAPEPSYRTSNALRPSAVR